MSPETSQRLMVLVERVVRPVIAPHPLKMTMRRELFAHLEQVYLEEFEKTGSDKQALAASEQRFGNVAEVRAQLQATIPHWVRCSLWAERLTARRAGDSLPLFAIRNGFKVGLVYSALILTLVGMVTLMKGRSAAEMIPGFFVVKGFAVGIVTSVMTGLGTWVVQNRLRNPNDQWGHVRRMALATVVCSLTFVLAFTGLMAYSTLETGLLMRIGTGSLIAGLVMFPIVCGLFVRERVESWPWDRLELIDG